jgi:hypothetical protein
MLTSGQQYRAWSIWTRWSSSLADPELVPHLGRGVQVEVLRHLVQAA